MKRKTAYLAGSMEYSRNAGISWRLEYEQDLNQMGFDCIIPEREEGFITDQAELNHLKSRDLPLYKKIMRQLIMLDLDFVNRVDLIIVKWDGEKTAGTIGEAQEAYVRNKPIYLITSLPFEEVPGWFLACFTKEFHTKEECFDYIRKDQEENG